jgi:hypothetical protein
VRVLVSGTPVALVHVVKASAATSRLKLAELSSAVGAGVLGVGIGALLSTWLRVFAVPVLVIGLLMHAWGMADKHRLEDTARRPAWSTALYWVCWIGLAGIMVAVIARALR